MNSIAQTTIQAKILLVLAAVLGLLAAVVGSVYWEQHRDEQEYKRTIQKSPKPAPAKNLQTADY